jgi:hypothetical protein
MDLRDDYRLLENNCQHFAKALIRDITGEDLCPTTIAELLSPFIQFADSAKNLARLRSNSVSSPTGMFHGLLGLLKGLVTLKFREFPIFWSPAGGHRRSPVFHDCS